MGLAAIYRSGLTRVKVCVELDLLLSLGMVGFGNSRGLAITLYHIHIAIKPEQQMEGLDLRGN